MFFYCPIVQLRSITKRDRIDARLSYRLWRSGGSRGETP